MRKELPSGVWLTFRDLPVGTTEEDVQAFLRDECGIEISLDCISTSEFSKCVGAIISLPRYEVLQLVCRAVGPNTLNGKAPNITVPERDQAR